MKLVPVSRTTTGKIERFQRTLREELLTGRRFADIDTAQAAIDAWAATYNKDRPHQSLGMLTPMTRFHAARPVEIQELQPVVFNDDCAEVQRRVATRGHVAIAGTQYAVGCAYAGRIVTVRIETSVVHCLLDGKLIKTLPRRHAGDVRHLTPNKKHRSPSSG